MTFLKTTQPASHAYIASVAFILIQPYINIRVEKFSEDKFSCSKHFVVTDDLHTWCHGSTEEKRHSSSSGMEWVYRSSQTVATAHPGLTVNMSSLGEPLDYSTMSVRPDPSL